MSNQGTAVLVVAACSLALLGVAAGSPSSGGDSVTSMASPEEPSELTQKPSELTRYRLLLNNLVAQNPQLNLLWEVSQRGPAHAELWCATVNIDGVMHGYAESPTKSVAKEKAAWHALRSLGVRF